MSRNHDDTGHHQMVTTTQNQLSQQHQGAGQQLAASQETASSFVAAQGRAMIEARFTVALRFPRNEDEVRQKCMKECQRPSFAAVAIYKKPVAGKTMEGLSIRAIEAALRIFKNVDIQTPTIYDDREKRIVRVSVVDLEGNLTYSTDITIEKTVERKKLGAGQQPIRSRVNSYGDVVHLVDATEDEVMVKQAALVSKAIRTNGQRLLPGDLVDEMMRAIRETANRQDAQDPDAARRKVFDFFAGLGVSMADLVKWLGHAGASLTPRELTDLRELAAAIKSGETTWVAIMDAKEAGDAPPVTTKGNKLRDQVASTDKPAQEGEFTGKPKPTAQMVHDAIIAAETLDDLALADSQINDLPKKEHQRLRDLVVVNRGRLTEA